MVSLIGLMVITAIPTVTGVAQAVSAQRNRDQKERDDRRMKKFHINVSSSISDATTGPPLSGRVILKNDRLWIGPRDIIEKSALGYVAEAFYIEYPDPARVPAPMGLVSQVADDPPLLNWIYIDKHTMELKYGNKSASIVHHIGPWDWSEDEEQVVFDDMEAAYLNAFYAVETLPGKWQLYFDFKGDSLESIIPNKLNRRLVELQRGMIGESQEKEDT